MALPLAAPTKATAHQRAPSVALPLADLLDNPQEVYMRSIAAIFTTAFLFTGCTWEAGGTIKPGYSNGHDSYVVESSPSQSGYGAPMVIDTHAECWLDPHKGYYVWYHQADVDHTSGYLDMIDEVWVDIYDNYGLAASFPMRDDIWFQEWAWPGWVDPYYGLDTVAYDGVWMYAAIESGALRCGSEMSYEIYTTVYDIDGGYITTVDYL